MWRPKPETAKWEAPPGIAPWRDLADEEFGALQESYDGDLTLWYEHADEPEQTRPKRKAATSAGGDD